MKLPQGFQITVYRDQLSGARQLALGEDGTVYVGSREAGKVYALRDADQDGQAEQIHTLATGLNMPTGVAYLNGSLYVAEINRILRYDAIGTHLETPPKPVVINTDFPTETHHGWKYLRFGPDGRLYTAVGAPCNICNPDQNRYAILLRLDSNGQNREIVARGIRNTVGFDWHPTTHELWFNDNGRDWLGDDIPPEELNHAPQTGLDFGYPYCHGGTIADPVFGRQKNCTESTPPAWRYPAHVAPLGMRFYTGQMFPKQYQHQLFVAQHGSWNRTQPQGYRVVSIRFADNKPIAEDVFIDGWLQNSGEVLGRPVDILQMPDGSLLISDDQGGLIYRISYQPH